MTLEIEQGAPHKLGAGQFREKAFILGVFKFGKLLFEENLLFEGKTT